MTRRFVHIADVALRRRYTRVPEIDAATLGFCGSIVRGATTPVSVPIRPDAQAHALACFRNVHDMVAREGGVSLFGWALFAFPGAYREAQHHAIWRSPDGDLVDVTPPAYPDLTHNLFLEDRFADVDCDAPAIMSQPLRREGVPIPEVQTYLAYHARIERAKFLVLPGEDADHDPQVRRLRREEAIAKSDMLLAIASACDEGDPCFCGTGLAFASCCAGHFS